MSGFKDYRCPKCGSKTTYRSELHGLCEKCYIETKKRLLNKLNMSEITIKKCNFCGRVFYGNTWIKLTNHNLVKVIKSLLKGKIKRNSFQTISFKVEITSPNEFKLNIRDDATGLDIDQKRFRIKYKDQVCPRCMMKYSGVLFECIIRVRGSRRNSPNIDNVVDTVIKKHISSVELVNIKKIKNGEWDLFFGNTRDCSNIARLLANLLKMEVSIYRSPRYFKGIKKSIAITEYVIK